MEFQIAAGAQPIEDAVVTRVGNWRNQALVDSSADHPEIPAYRTTVLTTVAVIMEEHLDRALDHAANGGNIEDFFVVCRQNINGDATPRSAYVGEKLEMIQITPGVSNGGERATFTQGALAGLNVFNGRILSFYPVPVAKKVTLAEMLAARQQQALPVATEEGVKA